MKINEQDKLLFDALQRSETGTQLVSYMRRLQDDICDVRSSDDIDPKVRKAVAEQIERHLIKPIVGTPKPQETKKKSEYS